MDVLKTIIEWLSKEWAVLRQAPGTFAVLVLFSIAVAYAVATWYYAGQLSDRDERIKLRDDAINRKDGEIVRLRVVAGLDQANEGALIALSNTEMRAKAATTVGKLREFEASFGRRHKQIRTLLDTGKIDTKAADERWEALAREASGEFQRGLRADAANVDTELRRRLGPRAVAAIVGVTPSVFSASDGAAIGLEALITSVNTSMSASFAGVFANGIDQMARMLPNDPGD